MAISEEIRSAYQPVIGLEIHVQLATNSKVFATEASQFEPRPNTQVSAITLAHPGALPSINSECIRLAAKIGLATECSIREYSFFARKNYFYPDLPKGYQLTQDDRPICYDGKVHFPMPNGNMQTIRLERIHLEEDAGKSIHDQAPNYSFIDLNRAGVGLIEMVTHPDLRSAQEAGALVAEVRRIVRYLEVSDGNMEEGSLRCDANVSVMPMGSETYGTRAEIKNINSISQVIRAITYEIDRQIEVIEAGGSIRQETRTWHVERQQTQPMRHKETADDYRYFPEPDLQPVQLQPELLEQLAAESPELPHKRFERYFGTYELAMNEAITLIEQREISDYFEGLIVAGIVPKIAANWLLGPIRNHLKEQQLAISAFPLPPASLKVLTDLIAAGSLSHHAAKDQLFPALLDQPEQNVQELAQSLDLLLTSQMGALEEQMKHLMEAHAEEVKRYRAGKKKLAGFFVGKLMREFKGKADPAEVQTVVRKMLATHPDKQ